MKYVSGIFGAGLKTQRYYIRIRRKFQMNPNENKEKIKKK
jgi:hypothetical protein